MKQQQPAENHSRRVLRVATGEKVIRMQIQTMGARMLQKVQLAARRDNPARAVLFPLVSPTVDTGFAATDNSGHRIIAAANLDDPLGTLDCFLFWFTHNATYSEIRNKLSIIISVLRNLFASRKAE